MPSNENGFKQRIWQEIEPLITHCVCVFIILLSLLLIAGLLWVLESLFPEKKELIEYIKVLDIWVAFGFICLFCGYTFSLVLIRLLRGIRSEWNEKR